MDFKDYKSSYIDTQPTLLKKFNQICKYLEELSPSNAKIYRHQIIVEFENNNAVMMEFYSNSANEYSIEGFKELLEDDGAYNCLLAYISGGEYFNCLSMLNGVDLTVYYENSFVELDIGTIDTISDLITEMK